MMVPGVNLVKVNQQTKKNTFNIFFVVVAKQSAVSMEICIFMERSTAALR